MTEPRKFRIATWAHNITNPVPLLVQYPPPGLGDTVIVREPKRRIEKQMHVASVRRVLLTGTSIQVNGLPPVFGDHERDELASEMGWGSFTEMTGDAPCLPFLGWAVLLTPEPVPQEGKSDVPTVGELVELDGDA